MNYDKLTTEALKYYKNKACKMAGNVCGKCEALYEHGDGKFCCFDTVIRFIEYANKKGLINETMG